MVSPKKVMDQTRSEILKRIVKVILFIALFTSFLMLYLINETNEYLKGSTTFASRTGKVDKFNLPVLVICFQPNYKPSIYGNGSTDFAYLFEKEGLIKKEDKLADSLQSASYKLNKDIQIEYGKLANGNRSVHILQEGQNKMDDFQIDVYKTYTLIYGSCYLIESNEKVSPWVIFKLSVKDLNSDNGDKLSSLNLFIASRETWHGIIALSWPYFELKQHTLSFNTSELYWFEMQVTDITYQNGHKRIEDCLENWMAINNECKDCSPFFFSFKNKKTVSCQSMKDNKCWYYWAFYGENFNEYKKCMKPMETTLFNAKPKTLQKISDQSDTVEFDFGYSSDQIKIEEEALMIGTSSYIGSVGGSLGLFLGFSVFTYLSYCIDKLFEFFH